MPPKNKVRSRGSGSGPSLTLTEAAPGGARQLKLWLHEIRTDRWRTPISAAVQNDISRASRRRCALCLLFPGIICK
jgi:hypothetical protein